jgi:hypothetical protein
VNVRPPTSQQAPTVVENNPLPVNRGNTTVNPLTPTQPTQGNTVIIPNQGNQNQGNQNQGNQGNQGNPNQGDSNTTNPFGPNFNPGPQGTPGR